MSNRSRFRGALLAAMSLGLLAAPVSEVRQSTSAPTVEVLPTTAGMKTAPTVTPSSSVVQALLDSHYGRAVRYNRAIWVASAKRGSRRHRSRWNYNR